MSRSFRSMCCTSARNWRARRRRCRCTAAWICARSRTRAPTSLRIARTATGSTRCTCASIRSGWMRPWRCTSRRAGRWRISSSCRGSARCRRPCSLNGPRRAERVEMMLDAGDLHARAEGNVDLVQRSADVEYSLEAPAMSPRPDIAWQRFSSKGRWHGNFSEPAADATRGRRGAAPRGQHGDRRPARGPLGERRRRRARCRRQGTRDSGASTQDVREGPVGDPRLPAPERAHETAAADGDAAVIFTAGTSRNRGSTIRDARFTPAGCRAVRRARGTGCARRCDDHGETRSAQRRCRSDDGGQGRLIGRNRRLDRRAGKSGGAAIVRLAVRCGDQRRAPAVDRPLTDGVDDGQRDSAADDRAGSVHQGPAGAMGPQDFRPRASSPPSWPANSRREGASAGRPHRSSAMPR